MSLSTSPNNYDEETQVLIHQSNSSPLFVQSSEGAADEEEDASRRSSRPVPNVVRLWITTMGGPVGAVYGMIVFVISYHIFLWIRINNHQNRENDDGHRVKSVDFHPTKHSWLLLAMYNGKIALWKTEEETEQPRTFLFVSKYPVRVAKFLSEDSIVTASDDAQVRILSLQGRLTQAWNAHDDYIRSIVVQYPFLITSGDDMLIKVWDMEYNFACIHTLVGHDHYVMQVKVNPRDPSMLASASLDRTVKLWKLPEINQPHEQVLEASFEHARGVNTIDFFPLADEHKNDESTLRPYLVSGSDDCTVMVWNYETKELLHTLRGYHVHNVNAVLFCSASCLVSASEDGTCVLWDAVGEAFQAIHTMSHGMGYAWNLAYERGHKTLAVAYEEGCVCLELEEEECSPPTTSGDSSSRTRIKTTAERRWHSRNTRGGRLFYPSPLPSQ
eukprot:scaffold9782_cov150-Amphora_coffeaeformis.AAC.4